MKTKKQKEDNLNGIKDRLSKSKITVFTSYARQGEKGLSVKDISELRKELSGKDTQYIAEKKRLFGFGLKNTSEEFDVDSYQGSLGIAYGYGDQAATAKTIYEFSKKHPALQFFGALFDGQYIDEERFTELAKLPTRDILISNLLGMLNYPIMALMNVVQGPARGLVIALDQISSKKN